MGGWTDERTRRDRPRGEHRGPTDSGNVWLGVEGETRDRDHWVREDGLEAISSSDMTKKMINELHNWDETPAVDPYEYAVEYTRNGAIEPIPLTEDKWVPKESAERCLEFNVKMFPDKMADYTVRLVKRRKAGRIEDV